MYCHNCGTQLEEGMKFCTKCGTKLIEIQNNQKMDDTIVLSENLMQNSYSDNNNFSWQGTTPPPASVSFVEAVKLFFKNYVNFTGRATRSEYWWAFLFNILVSLLLGWIPLIGQLILLATVIPGLAVAVRRLHDTGKSWTYILMELIPFVGFIILIVQYCKDSDGDNKWGPAPVKQ